MINHILLCIASFCCCISCNNNNNSNSLARAVDQSKKRITQTDENQPTSFAEKLKNRTPITIDKTLIFGEWEDQNSRVTYSKEYKFYGTFDKYQIKQQELGNFEINEDTLQMHFTSINHHPSYIITNITANEFTIQSLGDGAIFYKKRVK